MDMYVTELLKMRLVLSHAEKSDVEWIYAVRSWMMGELEGIMRKATDGDEEGACQDYIEWTMESLWDDIRSNDDWDQIEVMCDCTERAIRYGILRDGGVAELFVDMVAEESRKDHQGTRKVFVLDFLKNSEYVLVWYSRIFRILK
ncbi:MAG: hypothetical protein MPL62_15160, partial [Alphaproteobacteria bacterium]|nr:hypothetical protein [Alphaproteobacteria bacterium]